MSIGTGSAGMNIAEKKKNKGEKMGLLPWGMRHEFKNEDMEVKSGSIVVMSLSGCREREKW